MLQDWAHGCENPNESREAGQNRRESDAEAVSLVESDKRAAGVRMG